MTDFPLPWSSTMTCFVALQRNYCLRNLQRTRKHLRRARQLLSTQKHEDAENALVSLELALKICPQWDKALELKARALLHLNRFEQVAEMLHDFIPSLMSRSLSPESRVPKEKTRLLSDCHPQEDFDFRLPIVKYSVAKLKSKLSGRLSKTFEREQWMYVVLGQACCHLGMMEDAMILLQSGKRSASAASRRQSNFACDDKFSSDSMPVAESELVNQMLGNIKFLLRRRTAALAALEAGLYSESVRHFSKIVEGRKGTPQGFVADCYLHRAIAYQGTGKVAEAISDCNRTLSLNPNCTRALSVRASLYEMVKCYSECLLDLQQLKIIYEAALRFRMLPETRWMIRRQNAADINFAGGLEYINSKITTTRHRLASGGSIDARTILDLPRNCSMAEVEKAYLLISLKHTPEKAAHFVDLCELVDGRNIGDVREEARASALRLSRLIHKAYIWLLSSVVDEETRKLKDLRIAGSEDSMHKYQLSLLLTQGNGLENDHSHSLHDRKQYAERSEAIKMPLLYTSEWDGEDDEGWWDQGEANSFGSFEQERTTEPMIPALNLICSGEMGMAKETVGLESLTGFNLFEPNRMEELGNVFASNALADMGAMISKALGEESPPAWIRSPHWIYTTAQPLPVT